MNWTILAGAITPLLKSGLGWLKNAIAESGEGGKKITAFEWRKLGETILTTGIPYVILVLGLGGIGLEDPEFVSAIGAFIASSIWDAVQKKKTTPTPA